MMFGSARDWLHPEQRHLEPVLPGPAGPVVLYQTLCLVVVLVIGSPGWQFNRLWPFLWLLFGPLLGLLLGSFLAILD